MTPKVPRNPQVHDPANDANALNSYQGALPLDADRSTPVDLTGADILAAWFTHDAETISPHIQTEAPPPGEASYLFVVTTNPGNRCMHFGAVIEGPTSNESPSAYLSSCPGLRSKSWTKTKHFQTRNFALLGWLPPEGWRQDRGCVVLGLRSEAGIAMAGVVQSGYGRDLVEQLPSLTRSQLRALREPGRMWEGDDPPIRQVKYLEWSPAGGLRHATIVGAR